MPQQDRLRLFNRPQDTPKRQALRREATPAEQRLWERLRGQQIDGLRFRRQYGVGPYVLDFYCPAAHLAIEIDGASHAPTEAQCYDAARTEYLHACGIHVLRFRNAEVFDALDTVLSRIAGFLNEGKSSA